MTVGDLTAEAVGMKPIQARRFVRLATEPCTLFYVKKDAHSTHGVAGNACAEAVAVEPHPLADALD